MDSTLDANFKAYFSVCMRGWDACESTICDRLREIWYEMLIILYIYFKLFKCDILFDILLIFLS